MSQSSPSRHAMSGVILVAALFAALAIGAWQNRTSNDSDSVEVAAQQSLFVQSGGAAAEASGAALESQHARASHAASVTPSTF